MENKKDFATRLYELRVLRRLTQKELGEAVGLTAKSICTIESGERKTTIDKLIAIADYFDVSIDYLVGRSDVRERR